MDVTTTITDGAPVSMKLKLAPTLTKTNQYRVDLITAPVQALIHPEITQVIACIGRGRSCEDKNMLKRVLYSARKPHTELLLDVQPDTRSLFVDKHSVPKLKEKNGMHQFLQVHAKLKHADGTLAQKEPCVVEVSLDKREEATTSEPPRTQEAKALDENVNFGQNKSSGPKWYMFTGMGLGSATVLLVVGFLAMRVGKRIQEYRNRPEVAYGGVYKFANDPKSRQISKREKEIREDLELAKKLGLYSE